MGSNERYETETLEEGDIFFIYRPQVEQDEPSALSDVQRFQVALRPRGGRNVRLLILGRKRLPEVGAHERLWGFAIRKLRLVRSRHPVKPLFTGGWPKEEEQ